MIEFKDAQEFEWMWRNNGLMPDSSRVELKDAISTSNAPMLLPKVISNIVKEAAEPLLVGTSLLQRVQYTAGQLISFPAAGAMEAEDIPEGGEYPERSLAWGGSTVTAKVGKSGIAVKLTEEMVRYSQFDVVGMHLRAAGKALARLKETKIFNLISAQGTTVFDNLAPASSVKGVTTGRDMTGAGNGALTMDDVFDTFAQVIYQGFMPNTVLMHPLAWTLWVKDPVLRSFALAAGGGTFFATWTGNPAGRAPWSNDGGLGPGTGQNIVPGGNAASAAASALSDYPNNINSAPAVPNYFGIPLKIIVSPFVRFDPRRMLTDIYVFDSTELGALIVDEDITTEQFNDPRVDIMKIKLRERYALAILNEGQGIGSIKNVKLTPNEVVLPARANIDVSGAFLRPLDPTTSVL